MLRELDLREAERGNLLAELAEYVHVVSAHTPLAGATGVQLAAHQFLADAGGLRHGRSCHGEGEIARAVDEKAAWVCVSPVARTASKPGYGPPIGLPGLRRAVAVAKGTPVFALGGVEVASVADLRAAGAHGVAVMGSVMRAVDPAAVVSQLLAELEAP